MTTRTIKLTDIVWDSDREDLPKELELTIDQEYIDMMVEEEGFDPEDVLEDMLYEDLKEQYGVEVIQWVEE